ncbi:MAG TPA: TlpA disulfide reductase family protein [Gemmatimonadales bacterium]|nr:TlpA disulfide reductase family protein [Gemmatimonadales bacterium]
MALRILGAALTVMHRSEAAAQSPQQVSPRPGAKPQVDSQAVRLLNAANARLAHARTLRAGVEQVSTLLSGDVASDSEIVLFTRPGLARKERPLSPRADGQGPTRAVEIVTATDNWNYTDANDTVDHARRGDPGYYTDFSVPVNAFFAPRRAPGTVAWHVPTPALGEWRDAWLTHPLFQGIRYVGKEEWRGAIYHVVDWRYARSAELPEGQDTYTSRAYIGVTDTLIHRVVTLQATAGWPERIEEVRIADMTLDSAIDAAAFTPPPGRPVREWAVKSRPAPSSTYVGRPWLPLSAPARLLDGPRVRAVADLLAGKHAAVLWAWNTGCSSCTEEFPWMELLRKEYQSLGVAIVAVNSEDPEENGEAAKSRRYLRYHGAGMPVLFDAKEWVRPMWDDISFIVLDKRGIVRYAGGADLDAVKAVVARLVGRNAATKGS